MNKFSLVGRWWRTFYAYLETTLLSFTIAFASLFYSDNEYTYNSVIDIDSFYCFRDNIQRKNKLKKLVIILTSRDISFILGASNYIGEIVNTVSNDFYLDTKWVSHCDQDTIQL